MTDPHGTSRGFQSWLRSREKESHVEAGSGENGSKSIERESQSPLLQAPYFEMLGALNILSLQKKLRSIEAELETRFFAKQPGEAETPRDDQRYELAVAKLEAMYADRNSEEILNDLKQTMYSYNQAVLQQRELLRLPKVSDRETVATEGNNVQGDNTYLANIFEALSKGSTDSKHPYLLQKADAHTSIVSLDPCTCSTACAPSGLSWLLSLLVLSSEPQDIAGMILAIILLGILPTASILILWVIKNTWGRLGFIIGESAVVVLSLSLYGSTSEKKSGGEGKKDKWKKKALLEKAELLTYMLGMAAIQVVFVGSVISSS